MELFQKPNGKSDLKLQTKEDRITAYYVGKMALEELSEEEKKLMKRWTAIWTLLNNYHSPSQAVESHIKKQRANGQEISDV